MAQTKDKLMTPREVADYLGRSVGALAQLRYLGNGPAYIKHGNVVRYRWEAIEGWLAAGERTQT